MIINIADIGVKSLIPAWPQTFMVIIHEIISTVILLLRLANEFGMLQLSSNGLKALWSKRWPQVFE